MIRHVESLNQSGDSSEEILEKKDFHAKLESEIADAHLNGRPLALLMADVDGFKSVNDSPELGHVVGDEIIEHLRKMFISIFRTSENRENYQRDVVSVRNSSGPSFLNSEQSLELETQAGHIGGDEFAVICRTDEKGIKVIEERLRSTFPELIKKLEEEKSWKLDISISIGVGVLEPNMSSRDLLMLADHNMQEDKFEHLKPLPPEVQEELNNLVEKLQDHEARIRDFGKYAILAARNRNKLTE